MNEINFKESSSKRIYDDYMNRIGKAVSILPKDDQQDILMEFNSHIYEAVQNMSGDSEVDNLLDILQRLGVPEEILLPYVADKKLEQATKTFNPVHVFKALVLNISNGISFIVFSCLYLLLGIGLFLIVAKLIYPDNVGVFIGEEHWAMGYSIHGGTEILGNYFFPLVIGTMIFLYIVLTLLLKLKRKLKKRNSDEEKVLFDIEK